MIRPSQRLYRFLCGLRITRNLRALLLLSRYRTLIYSSVEISENGSVYIKGTTVDLNHPKRHFILQGFTLASDLVTCCKATLRTDHNADVILDVSGISVFLKNWQELFIAHEVFYNGCYNIVCRKPFHLIDVGFNVGMSSLFFASQRNCLSIDAYEPFPKTLESGLKNLDLNTEFKKKISLHNYGVASSDRDLVVDYCEELKGSIGINGVASYAKGSKRFLPMTSVLIHLKDATSEFRRLSSLKASGEIVCKLDCEGSEYEIIRSLAADGALSLVDIFMIEWHEKGPTEISDFLEAAGFLVLSVNAHSLSHGMIYAWKE
jgi:FkbM family methyltransferase